MTDKTLKQHVQRIGDLKAEIDALTDLFNKEKTYIIDALNERETSDFRGSKYAVKYAELTRHQVDTAKLKANHIYNDYVCECHTSKFTVKAI